MLNIFKQYKNFKAFEIAFLNENQESPRIPCTFCDIGDESIIIELPKNSNCKFPEEGDTIKLYVYADSGIYSAESMIIDVHGLVSDIRCVIEYPEDVKRYQRREFYRVNMPVKFELKKESADMQVPFKIDSTDTKNNCSFMFNGVTKNICGKGLAFISDKQLSLNSSDEINLTLYFDERAISVNARFVYSRAINNTNSYSYAFSFKDIEQDDIDFIVKKCFMHQLQHRKSGTI